MMIDYPLPIWRTWGQPNLKESHEKTSDENSCFTKLSKEIHRQTSYKEEDFQSNAYLFVLFIKLPSWKSIDCEELPPEIRTLRNLKNGIEVYQVKAALELSSGLPAHVTNLLDVKDVKYPDEARLVIGKNVNSGSSFRLEVISAWEEVIRAAWTNNTTDLKSNLPSFHRFKSESLTSFEEFTSVLERSGNEQAFCALFAASARGNLSACKIILERGFDPNQTTFFGNTSLHAAAHNGEFEVIQLLLRHGANIRAINGQKKTALDIAATSGNIDCARWLWLNQWSSAGKPVDKQTEKFKSTSRIQSRSTAHFSPAKPLKECTTLFTKPQKQKFFPIDQPADNNNEKTSMNRPKTKSACERPKSSPYTLKIAKSEKKVTFKNADFVERRNILFSESSLKTKRPLTALAKNAQTTIVVPKLLPQLAASLTRERSIPSVQETRYRSHKVAHLRVDVQSQSVVKPLIVDMSLNDHWINPRNIYHSFNANDINREIEFLQSKKQMENLTDSPQTTQNSLNLSAEKSSTVGEDVCKTTQSRSEIELFLNLNDFNESTISNAKDNQLKQEISRDYKNQISQVTSNQISKEELPKSKELLLSPNNQSSQTKPTHEILDSYDSLHGGSQNELSRSKDNIQNNQANVMSTKHLKQGVVEPQQQNLPSAKSLFETKSYKKYERKEQEEIKDQLTIKLSREQLLREERNKTAWAQWLSAKQKEVALKKKKDGTKKLHHDDSGVIKKFGITFDEWLSTKKKEAEKKPPDDEATVAVRSVPRRTQLIFTRKTFEEWVKEKRDEKIQENKERKLSLLPADTIKIEQKRQKSFEIWSAKKLEEAKKEKQKIKLEEEKQRSSLNKLHENWMSKERVMPFDAWKKKKEEETRMKIKEKMQQAEKDYFETWTAEQRKEKAKNEFQKWMRKKHLSFMQEATKELQEAQLRREENDKNMEVRRAMLKAKILLRWQRMAKENKKLKRKRSNIDSASLSLSSGDIPRTFNASNSALPSDVSDDEEGNFVSKKRFDLSLSKIAENETLKSKNSVLLSDKRNSFNEIDSMLSNLAGTSNTSNTNLSSSESNVSDTEEKRKSLRTKSKSTASKRKTKKISKKNKKLSSNTSHSQPATHKTTFPNSPNHLQNKNAAIVSIKNRNDSEQTPTSRNLSVSSKSSTTEKPNKDQKKISMTVAINYTYSTSATMETKSFNKNKFGGEQPHVDDNSLNKEEKKKIENTNSLSCQIQSDKTEIIKNLISEQKNHAEVYHTSESNAKRDNEKIIRDTTNTEEIGAVVQHSSPSRDKELSEPSNINHDTYFISKTKSDESTKPFHSEQKIKFDIDSETKSTCALIENEPDHHDLKAAEKSNQIVGVSTEVLAHTNVVNQPKQSHKKLNYNLTENKSDHEAIFDSQTSKGHFDGGVENEETAEENLNGLSPLYIQKILSMAESKASKDEMSSELIQKQKITKENFSNEQNSQKVNSELQIFSGTKANEKGMKSPTQISRASKEAKNKMKGKQKNKTSSPYAQKIAYPEPSKKNISKKQINESERNIATKQKNAKAKNIESVSTTKPQNNIFNQTNGLIVKSLTKTSTDIEQSRTGSFNGKENRLQGIWAEEDKSDVQIKAAELAEPNNSSNKPPRKITVEIPLSNDVEDYSSDTSCSSA